MSVTKFITASLAVLAMLTFCQRASAQVYTHAESPFELGFFDHDLQFFAPGDFSEFGDQPELPIGWYFNYNRLMWHVSRPQDAVQNFKTDVAWGNRIQLGYMTADDKGWDFEYTRINGPSRNLQTTLSEAPAPPITFVNFLRTSDVQLNRVFRVPLHHGGIFEPFIGARVTTITDRTALWQPTENTIVGGQVGCRWFRRTGRWTVSAGAKIYPAANFQYFTTFSRGTFSLAGDTRLEASYNITRDLSLVAGWQLMYFGKGIARNDNVAFNDQDVVFTGLTFGVEVNYR